MPKISTFPDLPKLQLPKGLSGSLWFYWYCWDEWSPLVLEVLNKWYPQQVVREYWKSVADAASAAQDAFAWANAEPLVVDEMPPVLRGTMNPEMWRQWAGSFSLRTDNLVDPKDYLPVRTPTPNASPLRLSIEKLIEHQLSLKLEALFSKDVSDQARSTLNRPRHLPVPSEIINSSMRSSPT